MLRTDAPFALAFALLVHCGADTPQPVVGQGFADAASTPTPTDTTPPPATSDTATPPPPPPQEEPWKTIVDLSSALPAYQGKPDDKKIFAKLKKPVSCPAGKPKITSSFPGSFTAKGATEMAYLIEYNCGVKLATPHQLVVAGGDKITRAADVPESMIGGISDVDADGDNEIVLVGMNGAS